MVGKRTRAIGLRLMPEEAKVIAEVSAETGLSSSDVVRQAIRKAYADRFKPPKTKKR